MSTSRLDGTSRFAQLHRQVADLGDDDRVQGAADPFAARTQLFKRPANHGFLGKTFNLLFGRSDVKRLVEKAMKEVAPLAADSREVADAIDAVRKEMRRAGNHVGKKSHDLRAGAIRAHLNTIETAAGVRRAPSLSDVPGLLSKGGAIGTIAKHVRDVNSSGAPFDADRVVKDLSAALAVELRKAGDDVRFSFSVSRGAKFKEEVLVALEKQTGISLRDEGDLMPELVDRAYEAAMHAIDGTVGHPPLPVMKNGKPELDKHGKPVVNDGLKWFNDGADANGKPLGPVISRAESFTLDNAKFTLQEAYGDGGNAFAGRYAELDGTGAVKRELVLKIIGAQNMNARSTEEAFQEMATEASAHRAANKGAPGEFGKLERVLRMPDGRLAMVMELAPHGHMHGLMQKMGASRSTNLEAVRRTLVKDALESVDALQRKAKMSHLDIKGANFFIGKDGKARLADFGLARKGNWRHMTDGFQNMKWNDPEAEKRFRAAKAGVEAIRQPFEDRIKNEMEAIRTEVKAWAEAKRNQVPANGSDASKKKLSEISKEMTPRTAAAEKQRIDPIEAERDRALAAAAAGGIDKTFELSGMANDLWSLGTVIWEIYAGHPLFDDTGRAPGAVHGMHQDFLALPDRKARSERLFGARQGALGVPPEIQQIILDLLDPDPAKRILPADALRKAIFQDGALGSKDVRDEIKALSKAPKPVVVAPRKGSLAPQP